MFNTIKSQAMKWGDEIWGGTSIIAVITLDQFNKMLAVGVGLFALVIMGIRAIIWMIRLRKEWLNRNGKPEPHDTE